MAEVDIEYKENSFEENPQIITWIQLFLVRLLKSYEPRTEWIANLIKEWEYNSKIDIYKYFFDDKILFSKEKEEWAIKFLKLALLKMKEMNLDEFSEYIDDEISEKVSYKRLMNVIENLINMIES